MEYHIKGIQLNKTANKGTQNIGCMYFDKFVCSVKKITLNNVFFVIEISESKSRWNMFKHVHSRKLHRIYKVATNDMFIVVDVGFVRCKETLETTKGMHINNV